MSTFKARLFGKFSVELKDQKTERLQARKVQELFSYLLISRKHPQSRETLCEVLWGDQPQAWSKKQLRQTLWRLQIALRVDNSQESEILTDVDWIQINPSSDFWLDIAEFERVFISINGKHVNQLSQSAFRSIQTAVDLYRGDLLEGWYQEWCLFERERFQVMYLTLLDKLVEYCEIHGQYDTGLFYGAEILRHDRAYERAHRQMMRLYFMAGNRTQALYQYKRCEVALHNELDIEPSELTKQLFEQIRMDNLPSLTSNMEKISLEAAPSSVPLSNMVNQLERFSLELNKTQFWVKKELAILKNALSSFK